MSWEARWEQEQQSTRNPHDLLLDVDQWTSNALQMAEGSPEQQRSAEIFAQVAIAKAIAGLGGGSSAWAFRQHRRQWSG